MAKRKSGSAKTPLKTTEPAKKKRKSSPNEGVHTISRALRQSSPNEERLGYDDYFTRDKYKVFASDDSLTLTMISKLLEESLEREIRKSKEEEGNPVLKLRWNLLNFHSVVRGFVRMFLPDNDYAHWNEFYTAKNTRTPVFKLFYQMFTQENIQPNPREFPTKSKFAQMVVGPWVDRLMRVQKTFTADLIAYLLCKIYEYKEGNDDFSKLGDIASRYDFFVGQLGDRLPVLYKKLEIPKELLDAEEPASESAHGKGAETDISDDTNENDIIQACFKRCRNEICSSAKPVLQKIDLAKELAEDHKKKQAKLEKKARCEAGCAELLQNYAAEMQVEEDRRAMYQQMKQEVDTTEDVKAMKTRADFYVQVIEVIFSSMTAAEQEAVLNGKMEIPWEEYDIEFEDEDK